MAEKCVFCGETAVVEENIDGADKKICIECGSLAVPLLRNSAINVTDNRAMSVQPSDIEERLCMSCGEDIGPEVPLAISMCEECTQFEQDHVEREHRQTSPFGDCDDKHISASDVVNSVVHSPSDSSQVNKSESAERNSPHRQAGSSDNQTGLDGVALRCESCGCASLKTESIGTEEKLVCVECGVVSNNSDPQLINNEMYTFPSAPHLPYFSRRKQKPKGLTAGLTVISLLRHKFSFMAEVCADAEEMYTKAYYMSEFFKATIFMKEHLAAACVFVSCRTHDIPISLTHFQKHVRKFKTFLQAKRRLTQCLDITVPHSSLSCQIGHLLQGRGMDGSVIARVRDILFLCRQAWLTQGRNREYLITLGAYYAFQSSPQCQGYVTLKVFRDKFSLPNVSRLLISEFSAFFIKLAQRIPWVRSESVKTTNVHVYIEDIVKYQHSLFQLAFEAPGDSTAESADAKTRKRGTTPSVFEKEILLPSILKKPRSAPVGETVVYHVPAGIDLDSAEISPTEFETEIDSYILSPEEQECVREIKLKNMRMTTAP